MTRSLPRLPPLSGRGATWAVWPCQLCLSELIVFSMMDNSLATTTMRIKKNSLTLHVSCSAQTAPVRVYFNRPFRCCVSLARTDVCLNSDAPPITPNRLESPLFGGQSQVDYSGRTSLGTASGVVLDAAVAATHHPHAPAPVAAAATYAPATAASPSPRYSDHASPPKCYNPTQWNSTVALPSRMLLEGQFEPFKSATAD